MNRSEQNRKVAISRWNNVLKKKTIIIQERSRKYPDLKARILAYLMGDGSVTIRKERNGNIHHVVCFFPDDKQMLQTFLEAFEKIYDQRPRIRPDQGHFRVTIESKPITLDLLKYGSFRSLEWSMPEFKERLAKKEWLRAFYDCEGYVGPKIIAVQSVNKTGLEQVQNLLKEFNITSRMYTYKRKQKTWNTNFLLYIGRKDDRTRFLNEVGFNHSRKLKKLKSYAGVA